MHIYKITLPTTTTYNNQDALQKYANDIGKAFANYRNQNNLSQKVPQLWGKAVGVPLHDSQIAYFEKGQLEPKRQFWLSLEAFNIAITQKKFPATDNIFTKAAKDRLKNAQPFLNDKNKPATALDFFAMAIGKQKINTKYLNDKITADAAAKYFKQVAFGFDELARNNMLSKKEAWEEILKTDVLKKLNQKETLIIQDIFRGENIPSLEQIQELKNKCGEFCCYASLKEWQGKLPNSIEKAYKQLSV